MKTLRIAVAAVAATLSIAASSNAATMNFEERLTATVQNVILDVKAGEMNPNALVVRIDRLVGEIQHLMHTQTEPAKQEQLLDARTQLVRAREQIVNNNGERLVGVDGPVGDGSCPVCGIPTAPVSAPPMMGGGFSATDAFPAGTYNYNSGSGYGGGGGGFGGGGGGLGGLAALAAIGAAVAVDDGNDNLGVIASPSGNNAN